MSNEAASDFQEHMVASVEKLAAEIGGTCASRLVRGETKNYFITHLTRHGAAVKVYVYLDEAGFYRAEEWHRYERCDFDSPEQLEESILSDLKSHLTSHGLTSSGRNSGHP